MFVLNTFLAATGNADGLVTRDLPMTVGTVHVEMIWHLRHDADPAHRWLRDQVQAAAAA